jgi:hypothetical protein
MSRARNLPSLALASLLVTACGSPNPVLPLPTAAAGRGSGSASQPGGGGSGSATPSTAATLTATVSSASVGTGCGEASAEAASLPAPPASGGQIDPSWRAGKVAGDMPPPGVVRQSRCQRRELQLRLQLDGAQRAAIRIARVVITSGSGAELGTATATTPTRWDPATNTYVAWDGTLDAPTAQVNYQLTALPLLDLGEHGVNVVVEGVLPDGTVLRSTPSYMGSIAAEPHVVT